MSSPYSGLPNQLVRAGNGIGYAYRDTAMDLGAADLLGFSLGSFIAQQVALTRPAIVRRLILASAAPEGAAGMHGWAPEVIGAIGTPETSPGEYLSVFFASSPSSQQAGQEALQRMYARTEDRDPVTAWATREAQYDAVCTWGIPDHARLQRLSGLEMPVRIASGDSDPMIRPHYSHLLAGLIPQARVKIYPDSAHGSCSSTTRNLPRTSRPSSATGVSRRGRRRPQQGRELAAPAAGSAPPRGWPGATSGGRRRRRPPRPSPRPR
jgi:hypothetical protein